MFLVWPAAADDIRKLLEADQLPGIPKAPETILEILLNAGVLAPQDSGAATWLIHPPGAKAALEAVKLSAPALLYAESDILPEALPTPLLTPPATASAVPRKPPASASPEQLPLLDPASAPPTEHPLSEQPMDRPAPPPAADAPEPAIPTLQAPLRLPVLVRDALQDIIATLASPTENWAAQPMEDGLFVPLAALAARQVAPPVAIRALAETAMLAREATLTRVFQGQDVVGVLLSAQHVKGLPPFPTSSQESG